jgi:enoyl-CoA hydratase/carnithine racemase
MSVCLRSFRQRILARETGISRTRFLSTLKESYENVKVELKDNVGLIRLHRPKALNALSDALFADLMHAATALDKNDKIGCLILTGSTKAFAAGADISEMKDRTFDYTYQKVR